MRYSQPTVQLLLFLLSGRVLGGWIDEDTPKEKRKLLSLIDGTEYDLVMSDEFNVPRRTFTDGDDPTWTALDKSDDDASSAGGGSLHFYNSTMITTTDDGKLEISTEIGETSWNHFDQVKRKYKTVTKHFKSGMLQSWNKFCFTGGIIEVDVQLPGDPYIGGLWPAIWMMGNLGRATYEASTNNIWPWSYDTCDRDLQQAQSVSACNAQNHYGLNSFQGRGSTEIDLLEMMTGDVEGNLKGTDPGIQYPYADFTLQVAPGVKENRPQSGSLPVKEPTVGNHGFTKWAAQTWYDGLETQGNTSLNPFFYGTYLGATKPEEPVSRNKHQVFQADAVGAMHQLTPSHFTTPRTYRLEWQPGPGGRLDWFVKGHKINSNLTVEDDGIETDWIHAFSIKHESLHNVTGAQIPLEPSYLIFNTAVSSTWGFPYNVPDGCVKCYDCTNATCACSFYGGFCSMIKNTRVAMYIDNVRVYQSRNDSAHVGAPHTLGCDPKDHPTREFIKGNEYRYTRSAPFSVNDKGLSLKKHIQNGGGSCIHDDDCGGNRRGYCSKDNFSKGFFIGSEEDSKCDCKGGYTGPNCLVQSKYDDEPGAWETKKATTLFINMPNPALPPTLIISLVCLIISIIFMSAGHAIAKRKDLYRKIYN